jgi:hypothetical protein
MGERVVVEPQTLSRVDSIRRGPMYKRGVGVLAPPEERRNNTVVEECSYTIQGKPVLLIVEQRRFS